MKRSSEPYLFYLFLCFWLILNLVQAGFTELIEDEAYYWTFAQQMDWGYAEQPPAVALLIFLGYWVFQNELGVRLFFVLGSVISIWCCWKITKPKDQVFFVVLLMSVLIMQVGFLAVPDGVFVLSTSLFFLVYSKYLEKDHWGLALVLGVIVAAMSYSKYHASIILLCAFLSHLKIARRPSFWLIPLVATILYIPHLHWQWVNDFPPIRYHILNRMTEPFSVLFPINYVLGQLLVFGPFVGFFLFWSLWKSKSVEPIEKVLRGTTIGTLLFFMLLALRGRVEPNWTVALFFPLIYFGYHYMVDKQNLRKWVIRLAIPFVFMVLLMRIYMVYEFIPPAYIARHEFHGGEEWANDLSKAAGDLPVILVNNYQKTSTYRFYAQKMAHSVSSVSYAGDQYDLWKATEEALQGDTVLKINAGNNKKDSLQLGRERKLPYRIIPNFRYYNRVRINLLEPLDRLPADTTVLVSVQISNPTENTVVFKEKQKLDINYFFFEYRRREKAGSAIKEFPFDQLAPHEIFETKLELSTPTEKGKYRLRFSIKTDDHDGRNMHFQKIEIY